MDIINDTELRRLWLPGFLRVTPNSFITPAIQPPRNWGLAEFSDPYQRTVVVGRLNILSPVQVYGWILEIVNTVRNVTRDFSAQEIVGDVGYEAAVIDEMCAWSRARFQSWEDSAYGPILQSWQYLNHLGASEADVALIIAWLGWQFFGYLFIQNQVPHLTWAYDHLLNPQDEDVESSSN